MVTTHLVLFSFFDGASPSDAPPPVPVVIQPPGGVRRGVKIRLGDRSRHDTAEFLKEQLRIRHPDSAFISEPPKAPKPKVTKAERALAAKLKAEALRVEEFERKSAQIKLFNEEILKLIYLASL